MSRPVFVLRNAPAVSREAAAIGVPGVGRADNDVAGLRLAVTIRGVTDQPFFFPAAAIALLCVPLIWGLIPRNRVYGIRTQKTMADESVWYRANRFGGWLFLLSGVVYLGLAWTWPMSGLRDPRFSLWLLHLGAFVGPLLASAILTARFLRGLDAGRPSAAE